MKPAGFLLLLPVGWASIAFAEEATTSAASRAVRNHIREGLPAFQPPPPPGATSETTPAEAEEPWPVPGKDVVILPKMTVKERRLPSDAVDYLMSRQDFNRKMRNLYLDKLADSGPLDAWLNSFTIPLFSPSPVARGRALQKAVELDRLADLMSKEEAKSLNGFYDELAGVLGRKAPPRR